MAKLEERHYEYLKNVDFLKEYFDILNNRLVYSNNKIEDDNGPVGDLYDNAHVLSLSDNLKAFSILLNKLNEKDNKLTEDLIKQVANTINKHSMYISRDYRKIGNNVKFKGIYPIEKVDNIENKMKELLDNYYNEYSKLDIFEREARFNIEFLRIHPFEDGNGRTSRLLLNYNLLRQGHAPVLMPENIREEYFDARNKEDVKWIKELFEKESEKELVAIDSLIESFNDEKGLVK